MSRIELARVNKIRDLIISILSVFVVSAFPVLFMYFQNADEAGFIEILAPLVYFLFFGLALFGFILLLSKDIFKSAIIAYPFILFILNYALLEKGVQAILPSLSYWHIIPIFLFILLHIAWIANKKMKRELAKSITLILFIVFGGLILLNGAFAIPSIANRLLVENEMKDNSSSEISNPGIDNSLPSIYYLVFDEYSSSNFMKKYYNYDNSSFTNKLEEIGFNLSFTSRNESILSSTIMTNIVNLDYVVDDNDSESKKRNLRAGSALYNILQSIGYKIQEVGDGSIFMLDPLQSASRTDATTSSGDNLSSLLFKNTAIYPFHKTTAQGYAAVVQDSTDFMLELGQTPNNGVFTAFHINLPHCPFSFDKDGNRVKSTHYINWKDQKYYLGQYKYATELMQRIVETIIANDPESIIILQSDHSARAMEDAAVHKSFDYNDITNFFNAVYFHGNELDIEELSGINTLVKVLNTEFGLEIPLKEAVEN